MYKLRDRSWRASRLAVVVAITLIIPATAGGPTQIAAAQGNPRAALAALHLSQESGSYDAPAGDSDEDDVGGAAPVDGSPPAPVDTQTAAPIAGNPAPATGQQCPDWVHAQYVTTGPDGKTYPTWHPPVDPTFGCYFGHEHGADPHGSHIFTSMPPFGYVGSLVNDNEAHEGFKVFVANAGDVTEGRTVNADELVVFHMGTAGVKRYSTQFHSLSYDYVARDGSGREAHVQGMADTGATSADGSGCDVRGAKSFSTIGCKNDYEVWAGLEFQVMHPSDSSSDVLSSRVTMTFSPAVFDPITTRDPRDNRVLIYTQKYRGDQNIDVFSPQAQYRGCSREAYFGPNYWRNAGKPTEYYTDVYGHVSSDGQDAAHPLLQIVSAVNSRSNEQFKLPSNFCVASVHAPN